jgi:hypothetical protein
VTSCDIELIQRISKPVARQRARRLASHVLFVFADLPHGVRLVLNGERGGLNVSAADQANLLHQAA